MIKTIRNFIRQGKDKGIKDRVLEDIKKPLYIRN